MSPSRRPISRRDDATAHELYVIAASLIEGEDAGKHASRHGLRSRLDALFAESFGRRPRRREIAHLELMTLEYFADHPSARAKLGRPP